MGTTGTELPAEDRIRWFGEFASPALEAAFRLRHATQDQFFARIIIASAALMVLLLGFLDSQMVPASQQLLGLWCSRIGFFILSMGTISLLRTRAPASRFERIFGSWYVLTVGLSVMVASFWPAGHEEMRQTSTVAVLMSYCIMPVSMRMQTAGALLHTAGALVVCVWLNPTTADGSLFSTICWLTLINVLGMFVSYRLHARQRLLFAALRRQSELSSTLAQALADVKTLRGLISVCAWCHKVNVDTEWQQLESYVRKHSHAEFTHGICPTCLIKAEAEAKTPVG